MSNVARIASIAANIPEVEPRVTVAHYETTITDSGNATFNIASVVRPNDMAIVVQSSGQNSNQTGSMSVTGFTKLISRYANDSYDTSLCLSYKHLGSTPQTSIVTSGNVSKVNTLYLFRAVGQASLSTSSPRHDFSDIVNVTSSNIIPPSLGGTFDGNPRESLIFAGAAANFFPSSIYFNEPTYLENKIFGSDAFHIQSSSYSTAQFAGTWPQGQVPYAPTYVSPSGGLNPDNTAITYSIEIELA